jgi:hypothetical protein
VSAPDDWPSEMWLQRIGSVLRPEQFSVPAGDVENVYIDVAKGFGRHYKRERMSAEVMPSWNTLLTENGQLRATRQRYEAALRQIRAMLCGHVRLVMTCPTCVAREALAAAQEGTP